MQMSETERDRDIARVRRTATGILLALFLVFLLTHIPDDPPFWVRLIQAMSEAGMVGGIADWFAVEALFRRPFGLPIPHTALLPNNQKRAADNIARFVDENFLVPERLIGQIREVRPVARLASWLQHPSNAKTVGRELSGFLHRVLRRQIEAGVGDRVGRFLSRSLLTSIKSEKLSEQITKVLKESLHGDVLDQILMRVRAQLEGNRDTVTKLVQDRSRWWIASTVDDRIVTLLVDGMVSVVDELSEDGSDLRTEFEQSVAGIIEDLNADGVITRYLNQGLVVFSRSEEYQGLLSEMITSILTSLDHNMEKHPDRFADTLAAAISDFAAYVSKTPEVEEELNMRLITALEALLAELRPVAIRYISQTIAEWDSEELVARMEMEVGRDLQFIRINGSVLGAFVGGTIYLLTSFLFGHS